jgi:hypothetical protein
MRDRSAASAAGGTGWYRNVGEGTIIEEFHTRIGGSDRDAPQAKETPLPEHGSH